jgi:hypothetical protein
MAEEEAKTAPAEEETKPMEEEQPEAAAEEAEAEEEEEEEEEEKPAVSSFLCGCFEDEDAGRVPGAAGALTCLFCICFARPGYRLQPRAKRERKQVERIVPAPTPEKKEFEIPKVRSSQFSSTQV